MPVTRTSAVAAARPHATEWLLAGVSLATALALILAVYGETIVAMVFKWYESGTFAHGFLIPPLTAYLVWRQRWRWAHLRPTPSGWPLILLPVAGFGWLIGDLGDVLAIQQVALIAMLELVVWAVLGSQIVRKLLFPLVFLWFVVPVGEFLVSPLQDFTAWFAVGALRLSGIPVLWEGRSIRIPSGDWLVAEACSGVRYVIPSVVLGMLYAWITYRSWRRRGAFVALALSVPIVANGVRAYGIILLAHLTDNRVAVGVDHLVYGWAFFGVVMFLLFVVGGRFRERTGQPQNAGDDGNQRHERVAERQAGFWPDSPAAGGAGSSSGRSVEASRGARRDGSAFTVAASALVLVLLPFVLSATWFAPPQAVAVQVVPPTVTPPWKPVTKVVVWRPQFVGADGEGTQIYAAGEREVQWYVAYYAKEQQGAELIGSANHVGGDKREWTETSARHVVVRLDGDDAAVQEQVLQSRSGQRRLVWTWYWVGGEYTASPYYAKLMRVKTRLLRSPLGAAAIVLISDHYPDAHLSLQDFLDHCASLGDLLRSVASEDRPADVATSS
jgi:exosortase A